MPIMTPAASDPGLVRPMVLEMCPIGRSARPQGRGDALQVHATINPWNKGIVDPRVSFGQLSSPRRGTEFTLVREPIFASWVISLCPDRELVSKHQSTIAEALAHYRYDRLFYSQFFPAEAVWWRLKSAQLA